ncbi:MAG: caspase family protein [Planctomycetota bacterium]
MKPALLLPLVLAAPQAESPQSHALLVGVGRYPHLDPSVTLDGPPNDVLLMRQTLVDVLDVPSENVRLLTTAEDAAEGDLPTRERILGEIRRVAALGADGSVSEFVLYLSGHGTQIPDDGDDELDGRDEAFLPCDVKAWDEEAGTVDGAIRDDEIEEELARVAEHVDRVILIVDSCSSGTILRGVNDEGVVWREVTPAELGVPADAWSKARSQRSTRDGPLRNVDGVVALYAAHSDERAPERPLPNLLSDEPARLRFGFFTHELAKELRRSGGEETFGQLLARLRSRYDAKGIRFIRPTGEGALDRVVRASGAAPPFQVLPPRGGTCVVQGYGLLRDAVVGATLDVYRSGGLRDPDQRLGAARVTEVELDRARATIDFEWPSGQTGAPARIAKVPVTPQRLQLAYEPGPNDEAARAAFDEALEQYAARFVEASETGASDWIVRGTDPVVVYRPEEGVAAGFVVEEGALTRVLSSIFRVENLFALSEHESHGGLPEGVEVRFVCAAANGSAVALPGAAVELQARNLSDERWYLTVHEVDRHYGISEIAIRGGRELAPDTDWVRVNHPNLVFTDDTVGVGHIHVIAIDRNGNLPPLTQNPLRPRRPRYRSGETGGDFDDVLWALAYEGQMRGSSTSYEPTERAFSVVFPYETNWPVVPPLGGEPAAPFDPRDALSRPSDETDVTRFEALGTSVVLSRKGGRQTIEFDLDGDSGDGLSEFDADLVLIRDPDRVTALYDVDGAESPKVGRFEVALIDLDGDGVADEAHRFDGDAWRVAEHPQRPLLQVHSFSARFDDPRGSAWQAWRNRAQDTVRAFLPEFLDNE